MDEHQVTTVSNNNNNATTTATPLPRWQMLSVLLVQFSEAMNTNILFPFVAFMVEDFGYTGQSIGLMAGLLSAAFALSQLCTSVLWGRISDTVGRKPSLICGMLGAAVGMLVFGFSKSYAQAIAGRILCGALSGNIGVLKSFLTEITDNSNRGNGFAYISAVFSIATIIAPLAGGMLSKPVDNNNNNNGNVENKSFLATYPYVLPCLLCASLNIIGALCCFFTMTETRGRKKPTTTTTTTTTTSSTTTTITSTKATVPNSPSAAGSDFGSSSESMTDTENPMIELVLYGNDENNSNNNNNEEEAHLVAEGQELVNQYDENDVVHFNCINCFRNTRTHNNNNSFDNSNSNNDSRPSYELVNMTSDIEDTTANNNNRNNNSSNSNNNSSNIDSDRGGSTVLRQRVVLTTTATYGLLALGMILLDETIPLFLKLEEIHGGLQFSSFDIGLLLSVGGFALLPFSVFLLPYWTTHYSKIYLYRTAMFVAVPTVVAWPLVLLLRNYVLDELFTADVQRKICWLLLAVLCVLRAYTATIAFTVVAILINHSVYDEHLGVVNGLGQSFASASRAIGPAVGGALWSLSLATKATWLNFLVCAVIMFASQRLCQQLPSWLEKKRQPVAVVLSTVS